MDSLHMEKQKHEVILYTKTFRIEGKIHILEGERITDFLCSLERKQFIPVTDASVFNHDDAESFLSVQYMSLNKDEITFVVPKNQVMQS